MANTAEQLPFDRLGLCVVCRQPAHDRFYDYRTLAAFLKQTPATLKTWWTLQNLHLSGLNSNREIAFNQLKREINNLPAGAPMFRHVRYGKKNRTFRPLPPSLAPQRWDGCVIAALAYGSILLGPRYSSEEHIAGMNLRKQRGSSGPTRPAT